MAWLLLARSTTVDDMEGEQPRDGSINIKTANKKGQIMRIGFDIGGTFTDVILLGDDGRITTTI